MKSKINKLIGKKVPVGLSALLIGFFVLICMLSVSFIFNIDQINQGNALINTNVTKLKSSLPVELTKKNSTTSPQPIKQTKPDTYRPKTNGYQLRVPILYYHYVGNNPNPQDLQRDALSISPDKFEEQMKYLKDNGYTSISLDTLYAGLKKQVTLPVKAVVLTFDDGYIDFYYNAYHILQNYSMSATVFIPTGLVGSPSYLTWEQIQEMQNSGSINFGAHSIHHYQLASLAPEMIFTEVSESKKVLQEKLGVPINFMAYPSGSSNGQVISEVVKAGFIGAVGTWSSKDQSEGTVYNMPRIKVSGAITLSTFASLVQ